MLVALVRLLHNQRSGAILRMAIEDSTDTPQRKEDRTSLALDNRGRMKKNDDDGNDMAGRGFRRKHFHIRVFTVE